MKIEELERELRSIDYSSMSKVKSSLLEDILELRRNKRQFGRRALYVGKHIAIEDLDYVAAAGTDNQKPKIHDRSK